MDQLEREVRAMLKDRAGEMPAEYEASTELVARTKRRRAMKMSGIAIACGALVIGVGAVVAGGLDSKHPQVQTNVPKTPKSNPVTPPTGKKATGGPALIQSTWCPQQAAVTEQPAPHTGLPPKIDIPTNNRLDFRGLAISSEGNNAILRIVGPVGWSCAASQYGNGSGDLVLDPTKATFFGDDKAPIKVMNDWMWHGSSSLNACAVFDDQALRDYHQQNYSGLPCSIPSGRTITKVDDNNVTFVDADGTIGAATLHLPSTTNAADGSFAIYTCKPNASIDAKTCRAARDLWVNLAQAAPGTTTPSVQPTSKVVNLDGKIGSLQMGISKRADIQAAIGKPDATARGNFGASFPDYDALGYDCTDQASSNRDALIVQPTVRGPYCATIYFVNTATKTLAGFETSAADYVTSKGTSAGMTEAEAQRREGKAAVSGCNTGTMLGGYPSDPGVTMGIYLYSGKNATDHVLNIAAEWAANQVGVLFC